MPHKYPLSMRTRTVAFEPVRRVSRVSGLATLWLLGVLLIHSAGVFAAVGTTAMDSIAITVSDMARSEQFYSRVLSFEKVADREISGEEYERAFGIFGLRVRAVRMRLGDEYIELLQFLTPRGRPVPMDSHSDDRWFQHIAIIVSDMDTAYARLRGFGVEYVSTGPQRLPDWNPTAAGIRAFYFRDPDEHNLEILQFPAGKGLPKWQQRDGRLFLGIDHTAIVVSDTSASLHYYRDALGLQVSGESENYGTEQEHLNNVFGVHLHITSLRPERGPGVELLEYLTPRTGRPIPTDTQANDLWSWHIIMRVADPGALEAALHGARALGVTDVTGLHDRALGWGDALLAHDPDGHATLVTSDAKALADARSPSRTTH
jgi:catechol 2,3-dioxygenase-like lactoylglutathione lyase family enzyme